MEPLVRLWQDYCRHRRGPHKKNEQHQLARGAHVVLSSSRPFFKKNFIFASKLCSFKSRSPRTQARGERCGAPQQQTPTTVTPPTPPTLAQHGDGGWGGVCKNEMDFWSRGRGVVSWTSSRIRLSAAKSAVGEKTCWEHCVHAVATGGGKYPESVCVFRIGDTDAQLQRSSSCLSPPRRKAKTSWPRLFRM